MRGRPPKPNAVKLATGSRHARVDEPTVRAGVPTCPDYLDDVAREHWARVTALMSEMKTVTLADGDALALYCCAYSVWRKAMTSVNDDGLVVRSPNGHPIQNPFLAIMNKAFEQMSGLLARFGFTPADRARVYKAGNTAPPTARPATPGPAGSPKMRLAQ